MHSVSSGDALGSSETFRMLYDSTLGRSGTSLGGSETIRMLYGGTLGRAENAWEALRHSECCTTALWDALGMP